MAPSIFFWELRAIQNKKSVVDLLTELYTVEYVINIDLAFKTNSAK